MLPKISKYKMNQKINVEDDNTSEKISFGNSVLGDREYWENKRKIHQIHQILPNMFLTSAIGASRFDQMKILGITHIFIPASIGVHGVEIMFPENFMYKQLDIKDTAEENISQYFETIFKWMDEVLANSSNKLLVHCARGISRSASFVIGYLMHSQHISYDEAFDYVVAIRPHISLNAGFEMQLRTYCPTSC